MQEYPNGDKVTTKKSENSKAFGANLLCDEGISQIYQSSDLIVHEVDYEGDSFKMYATSSLDHGICPYCGHLSHSVHSRYVRTIQDLSILGRRVIMRLGVRKFFCHNQDCRRKTFAEQPGDEVFRYRRRTCRCERVVARHGISVSSSSASRLLGHMGIHISSSTVLRDVHRMRPSDYKDVEQVGVDDWAWQKGVTYGSIIIDLENGWVIDLLGDRETESFRMWMEQHQEVRLVSRDRSTDYSSAVAMTGRKIDEVADKFHLVKNILDRMTKLVAQKYAEYRTAVRDEGQKAALAAESKAPVGAPVELPPSPKKPDGRQVMFNEVKELQRKGFKPTTIAKKLGIARQTATKYCELGSLPPRNSTVRNEYYKYDAYVEQESAKGKALSTIFHEICSMGFSGSLSPFYDHYKYLSDGHRGFRPKPWKPETEKERPKDDRSELMPVKAISSIIDKSMKGSELDETQKHTFSILMGLDWFREMYEAMVDFCSIIKGSETTALVRWMKRHWHTGIDSLKTFVIGIKKDYQAVRNTIRTNVTNGITEGFVNKLKAVKRMMYGRAGIKLLKRKLVMEHILFN